MTFNEDSRVKIPTLLHLTRLGYTYISLKNALWDENTNIFPTVFIDSISRINPGIEKSDVERLLDEVSLLLDNEDLGKAFYERITERSGIRLIDFENFENNTFNVVTELTCKKDDEEFRPDITLLINGMPLAFIEVKTRNSFEYGYAYESVNSRKQKKIINASLMYLQKFNLHDVQVRFDVIEVYPLEKEPINHFENAFSL